MKCHPHPQPRKGRFTPRLLSLLVSATMLACTCLGADGTFTPASESDARTVAANWLSEQLEGSAALPEIAGVSPLFDQERANQLAWLVDLSPEGYVLLPVYRELSPLAGYSLEADLDVLGTDPATNWFRANLSASIRQMEAMRNHAEARERFSSNRALWDHWLNLGQRAEVQGAPVIEFVYRESLLNDHVYSGMSADGEDTPPDYPGEYQKPLNWHSGHPYNRKAPVVQTTPEEIWVDMDDTGTYTETDEGNDLKAYDADASWDTSADPPETGFQTGLYFFDDDSDGLYSHGPVDDDGYIISGGEWIWRDENGDEIYTYGIDQPIKPAISEANQSDWKDRDEQKGAQGNLYYTSTISDGRYTFTEAHTRPGGYATAMAMMTRYWEWPDVGLGEHSYDWAYREGADEDLYVELSANFEHAYNWPRMPLNSLASYSLAEQNNVAQLLYDVGVALEVDFQLATPAVELSQENLERFAHHFRYNRHAIRVLERANIEGDDAWFAEIAEEIDAKRPVAIQAFAGGDTFVNTIIDGYLKSTGYTDDTNPDSANTNMYLVRCIIGGSPHWWGLGNIGGIPHDEPEDAMSDLINQKATVGIIPQRVPQTVICEAFVEEGSAGTDEFKQALTEMQNHKGRRFLTLVYHPEPADPQYLGDHDLSQDILDARMDGYGLDNASYPVALLNGKTEDRVQGSGDKLEDQLNLFAAFQRQTTQKSKYRIVGDSVIGATPDEDRPVAKADIYVTRLDEDEPASETLTLTTVLAEKVDDGAHWAVREFLDSREMEFGYGLTRIANVTQLPELPEGDWDLDNARIIALLERADGTVVQAARMQRFAPGPNYQIVDGLGLYRATLVNHAPKAPTEVIITQTSDTDTGETHLQAEAVGAYDPDGDALRYEYSWYKNGIRQADLDTVTADSTITITDPNPDANSLWYCEVRVLDEYFEQGNTLDSPGDPGSSDDPVEKEFNHVSTSVISNPLLIANGEAPQENQPPNSPSIAEITPDNASVQDTLTCMTDDATDPDGDHVNLIYKWYKDGVEQPDHTTPRLPYGVVAAGEEWKCEVIAQDMWGAQSDPVESATITIAEPRSNPPSKPQYVSVGPADPSYTSTLSCGRPIGVVSDSDDPLEFHYRWWRMDGRSWRPTAHSGVIAEDEEWDSQVEMTVEDIGTVWRCEIFARNSATGANGPVYTTESLLVRNKAPEAPTASVVPQSAKLTEDLRCLTTGGFDAEDSTNIDIHYEWFVNGKSSRIAGFGVDTVDASFTSAGETWTCKVYAQDSMGGRSNTITASGEIFIGTPPTPPESVTVSPRRPESDQVITCTASGATDPDGQPVSYEYKWYLAKRITSTSEIPPPAPEMLPETRKDWYWEEAFTGATLLPEATSYGERYACLVTATDGMLDSSPLSSPKIIIGNQPPSKPEIEVTPESPRAGEEITCEISADSSDIEGDPFSYVFEWLLTDSDEVQYRGATLPAGRTANGETWYCRVTVRDDPPGDLPSASNTVQSREFPFVSVPPTAPTDVTVAPSSPKTDENLVCTAEGSTDPNGDAITYTYTWQKDIGDGWQDTDFSENVLDANNTADDDQWRCVVTAVDSNGMHSDPVQSSPVSVGNRAPSNPATPELTPAPAGLTEDLACAADGSSDPNDDPVTYEFQWW
ncbi:MAG: C10 family peptidase, partial [Verrucomicrobiota bacterium]